MAPARAGALTGHRRGRREARYRAGVGHRRARRGRRPGQRDVLRHARDRNILDDAPRPRAHTGVDPLPASRRCTRLHRPAPSVQGLSTAMKPEAQVMTAEEITTAIAKYASDRKALEIVQLDLR